MVYIIAYDMGETIDMYVGESGDLKQRMAQHRCGAEMGIQDFFLQQQGREVSTKSLLGSVLTQRT